MGRIHSQPVSVHSKKRRKDTKGSRTVLFTGKTNYIRILSPLRAGIKQSMEPGILWKLWRAHNMAQYKCKRLWRYPIKLHRCNGKEGDIMFDKFGEFDSAGELNKAAAGQLKENDIEALMELAAENGIDKDDALDYINGCTNELCSDIMAAYGKLEIEKKDIKGKGKTAESTALKIIIDMTCSMCDDMELAKAVRKKGKSIKQIYELMKQGASKHRSGSVGIACGTDRQLKNIIRNYYLEGDKKATEYIESLYGEE